jgi:hypothetical protein
MFIAATPIIQGKPCAPLEVGIRSIAEERRPQRVIIANSAFRPPLGDEQVRVQIRPFWAASIILPLGVLSMAAAFAISPSVAAVITDPGGPAAGNSGSGTAGSVNAGALDSGPQILPRNPVGVLPARGIDGRPTGETLPSQPSSGVKHTPR